MKKVGSMRHHIWAPRVDSLTVVQQNATSLTPQRGERGRFLLEDFPLQTRYRLRVDDKGEFPDPRSQFQPDGVHGPSMLWDHDAFERKAPFLNTSLKDAVIYELHIGTFSKEGTYVSAIQHLDHLVELGVTHVELMPLSAFPGRHGWGYDGVALFAPHAPYGTPDELKTLIDQAHQRGLSMLIDLVFNHLGPDGNYLGLYAPYFSDRYRTPWGEAVNLDAPDSDLVRQTFIDCVLYWVETYGFDGVRLDAVQALHDQSAVPFLEQLAVAVEQFNKDTGRTVVLIAECDLNDPRYVRSRQQGGFGLDAQWCDDFHHALHGFFTKEADGYYEDYGPLTLVAKALRQGYVFDGAWSSHRRRYHGRPPTGISAHNLVVCCQNHDQVGNRARGERLSTLLDRAALAQVVALTLLSPFVPLIFQGEEWGTGRPFLYFTDHQDAQLAKNVTEGRQREFSHFTAHHGDVPNPQAPETFQASVLDWSELQSEQHRAMLDWYKQLLRLRPLLGPLEKVRVDVDPEEKWLHYESGELALFENFSSASQSVPGYEQAGEVLLSFIEPPHTLAEDPSCLPPRSVVVRRRTP